MAIDKQKVFQQKKRVAILSMTINALLALIKLIGGIIAKSSVLIADGIHSLSDLAAAFSVFIGIVISNRKSKAFPYGLYKVENLVAIISSFAIFLAGYEIARDVLLQKPKKIESFSIALIVVALAMIITYLFSTYEKKIGRKINSPSLIADAEHVKTDMFSSIVVFIGILAQYFKLFWLEKIAVIVIVIFILYSGFEILKESIKVLLDASIDAQTLQKIQKLLEQEPLVVKINSITGRNSGSYIFIELDLTLATNTLEEAHKFSDYIENKIKEQIPFVEKVIVHYQQGHKSIKIAVLTDEKGNLCSHFGACPKIHIFTKTRSGFDEQVLDNPVAQLQRKRGIELVKFLKQHNVSCVVIRNKPDSETVLALLNSYFIDLIPVQKQHISQLNIEKIDCT